MCVQFQRYCHKSGKRNMSTIQERHKWSKMRRNKYGCQVHRNICILLQSLQAFLHLFSISGFCLRLRGQYDLALLAVFYLQLSSPFFSDFSTAESLQLCYTNHPVVVISIICVFCIIVDRC